MAAVLCLGAGRANAAYDMFLNIGGISGESTANGHTNEIGVLSFSFSVTNTGTVASFSGMKVTKMLDKASPLLVLDCAQSTAISKVVLTLRDQTAAQVEFYTITLRDVVVTSVVTAGSESDARPIETITFSFQKIEWKYQPTDADGNPAGQPIQTSFTLNSRA